MPVNKAQDVFPNKAVIYCEESAVNTLTYVQLATNISTFEKVAWIIHRIEYKLSDTTLYEFTAETDKLSMAVTRTEVADALEVNKPEIIDMVMFAIQNYGTPANAEMVMRPYVRDFSTLPGGGLITPASPLYGAIHGAGLAAVGAAWITIYYTLKHLKTEEYWELLEATRLVQ